MQKGKVSVVMPSYLKEYDGSAKDRVNKFVRAVYSFLDNTYENKELIIIGDSCKLTALILNDKFKTELFSGVIKFYNFKRKQRMFSGKLRDKGLKLASGEIIMYLDSDDIYGHNHIKSVYDQMMNKDYDWCYFNDHILRNSDTNELITKQVSLEHGSIGTSSIAHINSPKISWKGCNGYGHDWKFVNRLLKFSYNYKKIFGCMYIICHIPEHTDN